MGGAISRAYLLVAGVLETVWAVALRVSNGFSRAAPATVSIAGMVLSVVFLSLAIRRTPLGTGHAAWTGTGATGTFIAGVSLFGEASSAWRILCVGLVVAGIAGPKLPS